MQDFDEKNAQENCFVESIKELQSINKKIGNLCELIQKANVDLHTYTYDVKLFSAKLQKKLEPDPVSEISLEVIDNIKLKVSKIFNDVLIKVSAVPQVLDEVYDMYYDLLQDLVIDTTARKQAGVPLCIEANETILRPLQDIEKIAYHLNYNNIFNPIDKPE